MCLLGKNWWFWDDVVDRDIHLLGWITVVNYFRGNFGFTLTFCHGEMRFLIESTSNESEYFILMGWS